MKANEKLDLYRLHKDEYAALQKPVLVEVGRANYLAIAGRGEPGSPAFQAKLAALYNVAFTIKMNRKRGGEDYSVCKLEGLWRGSAKGSHFFDEPRDHWQWELIIRTPDFIRERDLQEAIEKLKAKGRADEVKQVALKTIREGRCAQMLHVGAYDEESRTIARIKQFVEEKGLSLAGLHHEIYLSDPRRVAASRLRTILRYPVK